MVGNTIVTAMAEGARIALPGMTHDFELDSYLMLHKNSLQNPLTHEGAIRRDEDGTQMSDAISRVVLLRTNTKPYVAVFPRWLVTLASPFPTVLREMIEMHYRSHIPLQMGKEQLLATLEREAHPPRWIKRSRQCSSELTASGLGKWTERGTYSELLLTNTNPKVKER